MLGFQDDSAMWRRKIGSHCISLGAENPEQPSVQSSTNPLYGLSAIVIQAFGDFAQFLTS